MDAVSGGRVAEVAAAFDQTVEDGLSDQLIAILREVFILSVQVQTISLVESVW